MYADFGTEVKFTLNPFVYGTTDNVRCFDEASPCVLEQTSMCVIKVSQDADSKSPFPGQDKYVPWLLCMDEGNPYPAKAENKCTPQVGVDVAAVKKCLTDDAPALVKQYLQTDMATRKTPTVAINGVISAVKTYSGLKAALCKADPTLKGCSSAVPDFVKEGRDYVDAEQSVIV